MGIYTSAEIRYGIGQIKHVLEDEVGREVVDRTIKAVKK